jgi:putative ATPase
MKQRSFDELGSGDDGEERAASHATLSAHEPLAARMRPRSVDDFIGQSHILAPGKPLYEALVRGIAHSMILWGPPGTGKTTLANIVAAACEAHVERMSAVLAGVRDIRSAVERARERQRDAGRSTILFVDEVHRFNKGQQDAFLPHIEDGTVIFIGATTENPSFELNNALLSRARTYVLKSLDESALVRILEQALHDTVRGLGDRHLELAPAMLKRLAQAADGDARRALNLLEIASDLAVPDGERLVLDDSALAQVLEGSTRRFDKGGDLFYEQISALHKAVRGSAPDAALYWMMRMLDGGCDPVYVARRLVRMASEDIGNADPRALQIAMSAWDAMTRLGSPEGELTLGQAVLYLACAPKSNAVYQAFNAAAEDMRVFGSLDVPEHLRNAPTELLKELGYGGEYRYAHDEAEHYAAGENYFPQALQHQQYYYPSSNGLEQKIGEKLEYLRRRDEESPVKRYTSPPK